MSFRGRLELWKKPVGHPQEMKGISGICEVGMWRRVLRDAGYVTGAVWFLSMSMTATSLGGGRHADGELMSLFND